MSPTLKDRVAQIAERIQRTEVNRKAIVKWVDTYYGKIITIKADDEAVSLAFTHEGKVKVLDGELPSPDVALMGSSGDIYSLLDGKISAKELAKSRRVEVRGSLHEWFIFEDISRIRQ